MRNKHTSKKPAPQDWHPADIVSALRKAGWSMRQLSLHHGYKNGATLKHAIQRHWPKGERLIAAALGIDPAEIWPSRYAGKSTTQPRKNHQEAA